MSEQEKIDAAFARGFQAGWDARAKQPVEIPSYWPLQGPFTPNLGCPVCGIGKDGKPMSYVCNNQNCPTRITCNQQGALS